MSYYNQPDHERIDRRDSDARRLLIRFARSSTVLRRAHQSMRPSWPASAPPSDPVLASWLSAARALQLPRHDVEPLQMDGHNLPLVWRDHYLAAAFSGIPEEIRGRLEDKGFEVIVFETAEASWNEPFARLAAALGRSS
ncbi:MAG: hypothetical protein MUF54_03640 [Polyangiaceae bacterium]|jgi:hypothetical protein|nr:hypothetical protein [Polyangiaceae bacterium]